MKTHTPEEIAFHQLRRMTNSAQESACKHAYQEVRDEMLCKIAEHAVKNAISETRFYGTPIGDEAQAAAQFRTAFRTLHKELRIAITTERYKFRRQQVAKTMRGNKPIYNFDIYDRGEFIGHWSVSAFSRNYMLMDRVGQRVLYQHDPSRPYDRFPVQVDTKSDFTVAVVRRREFIRSQAQIDADAAAAKVKAAQKREEEKIEDAKRSKERRAERLYTALKNISQDKPVSAAFMKGAMKASRALISEIDAEIARNAEAVDKGE